MLRSPPRDTFPSLRQPVRGQVSESDDGNHLNGSESASRQNRLLMSPGELLASPVFPGVLYVHLAPGKVPVLCGCFSSAVGESATVRQGAPGDRLGRVFRRAAGSTSALSFTPQRRRNENVSRTVQVLPHTFSLGQHQATVPAAFSSPPPPARSRSQQRPDGARWKNRMDWW